MQVISTGGKQVVFSEGYMLPVGATAQSIEADADRAEQAASNAAASAAAAAGYAVPRFNTRAAAAAAAATWANGTVLYVNSRKFVVDTAGPDRLLAIDYDWSGRLDGQISRALMGDGVRFACYGDSTTDGNGTTDGMPTQQMVQVML